MPIAGVVERCGAQSDPRATFDSSDRRREHEHHAQDEADRARDGHRERSREDLPEDEASQPLERYAPGVDRRKEPTPYMQKLHFQPGTDTADPNERVLSDEDLQRAADEGKMKERKSA